MATSSSSMSAAMVYPPVPSTVRAQPAHIGTGANDVLIYCVSNSVVVRHVNEPSKTYLYQQHKASPTVARMSPSGYYIASGDQGGTVRIWDTTQEEHVLKAEYRVLGGAVSDMDWSSDNTKLAIAGQGKEKFAVVIAMDTGTNVGDITGHNRTVNSIHLRPTRPFRLVTGSEDMAVNFYEGPPFRFKRSLRKHDGYVNCIRYSPGGEWIASCGSDKNVVTYKGDDAEPIATATHQTGVMAIVFISSEILASASTDRTVRLWKAPTLEPLATYTAGTAIDDQQLGIVACKSGALFSTALTGYIQKLKVLDQGQKLETDAMPLRGHNRRITALATDASQNHIISADFSGRLLVWDFVDPNKTAVVAGSGHSSQISAIRVANGKMLTIGMDDMLIISSLTEMSWGAPIELSCQPLGMATSSDGSTTVVVAQSDLMIVTNGNISHRTKLTYDACSVAITGNGSRVAVGARDNSIYLYDFSASSSQLTPVKTLSNMHRGEVRCMAYHSGSNHLVSADSNREVIVTDHDGNRRCQNWVNHTTSINDVAWSPDGQHIASVATDAYMIVWSLASNKAVHTFKNAHQGGATAVCWMDDHTVITGGQDCALKQWKV